MDARPTHELVWVTGADAVSFLDGLLSQAIASMEPGTVERSFLLAPNGKLRALLWVLRRADRVGLIADHGFGQRVVEDLTRFKLRVEVELSEPTSLYTVLNAGADVDGIRIPLGDGWRVLTTDPDGAAAPDELALLRIEAGEPVMGVDVDESTIPQETGLVPGAVDFTKGCYLGQELVARIDSRGHVNRRLARVDVGDAVLGDKAAVSVGGADAGLLTTTATGVGMGLLRREAKAGDTVLVTWAGGEADGELTEFALP